MDDDKEKRLRELVKKNGQSAKRTTVILEKEEREYVDSLVRDGKESGIKPLISKMLDIYRSMGVHDWRFPGEYYSGISRIAFVNLELINTLINHVPHEQWRQVGREMGSAAKISMETTLGLQTSNRDKWKDVFKRLKVQGFGDVYLRDTYVLITAPFIDEPEIWAGFLEGLLNVGLDPKTSAAPFVFEIRATSGVTAKE